MNKIIPIKDNINNYLSSHKANNHFYEIAQLKRAKMQVASYINTIDGKKILSPALHMLLEASLVLQTTNSKILAGYLKRTPATIRMEFERIGAILEINQGNTDHLNQT